MRGLTGILGKSGIRKMHRILFLLLFPFLGVYCSQWGGSNPVGVTGGSDAGYGDNVTNSSVDDQQILIGNWKYTYKIYPNYYTILSFYINNQARRTYFQNGQVYTSHTGTFEVSGRLLYIYMENEMSVYRFYIMSNKLFLTTGNTTTIYLRSEARPRRPVRAN
jgi:hypothetical protein